MKLLKPVLLRSAILSASFALATLCYSAPTYKGDGTFVDHGSRYWANRYELDLGLIDLTQSHKLSFHAAGLPAREFVVGVVPDAADCQIVNIENSSLKISFEIKDEHGSDVISEEEPLNKLTWEKFAGQECKSSFGYVRGQSKEAVAKDGEVSNRPIYTGVDCGRGTYFSSHPGGTYDITFTVQVAGQVLPERSALRLVLRDVGVSHENCPKK